MDMTRERERESTVNRMKAGNGLLSRRGYNGCVLAAVARGEGGGGREGGRGEDQGGTKKKQSN